MDQDPLFSHERTPWAHDALKGLAALVGIIAMVIGLVGVVYLLINVFTAVKDPSGIEDSIARWTELVAGGELQVEINEQQYNVSKITGFAAFGMGVLLIAYLCMGLLITGGKVVSTVLGDKEAVKRLLTHAFGSDGRPGI